MTSTPSQATTRAGRQARIVALLSAQSVHSQSELAALLAPRGYDADHPRITLLRHKTLTVSKHFGSPGWLETPKAAVQVRDSWRKMTPLVEWAEQILR